MKKNRPINRKAASLPTIKRLPAYLQIVRQADIEGHLVISGTTIAEELELEPIQVRKDLAVTGIVGKPRVGYVVKDLISALEHFLRWDVTHDAILIGVGHLGTALLGHSDFRQNGLNIVGAFDSDPNKIGQKLYGIKIMDISDLKGFLETQKVTMAILTVPGIVVHEIAATVVECGVKALWNFTNQKLKINAKGVTVQKEDLSTGYAVLSVGR